MAILKVWLDECNDEYISCGNCAEVASKVFEVADKTIVIEGVNFTLYDDEIREVVNICPNVIKIESI